MGNAAAKTTKVRIGVGQHINDMLIEGICAQLAPFAAPGILEGANRWNIQVYWSKKLQGLVMFHGVTRDGLAWHTEVLLKDVAADETYIYRMVENTAKQLDIARAERQRATRIDLRSERTETAKAVRELLNG